MREMQVQIAADAVAMVEQHGAAGEVVRSGADEVIETPSAGARTGVPWGGDVHARMRRFRRAVVHALVCRNAAADASLHRPLGSGEISRGSSRSRAAETQAYSRSIARGDLRRQDRLRRHAGCSRSASRAGSMVMLCSIQPVAGRLIFTTSEVLRRGRRRTRNRHPARRTALCPPTSTIAEGRVADHHRALRHGCCSVAQANRAPPPDRRRRWRCERLRGAVQCKRGMGRRHACMRIALAFSPLRERGGAQRRERKTQASPVPSEHPLPRGEENAGTRANHHHRANASREPTGSPTNTVPFRASRPFTHVEAMREWKVDAFERRPRAFSTARPRVAR